MAITLPDARQLSDEVLEALRLRALRGRELGFIEVDIANMLGVATETVCRWWVAYSNGGVEAIPQDRTGRPLGSGRTLSDEQAKRVQQIIDTQSPEDVGIASPLWSRRAVRDLIAQECGVTMPVRTVGEYLRRWGYTAKKPRRHNRRQNPQEVREWLEKTYPAIKERARKEHAEIQWCDETGIAADEYPGYGYAREGQAATMEVPDPHIRINMVSAISNEGTLRFMTYPQTMTGELFIVFLGRLLRSTTGKIFLMIDRLRAHGTPEVKEWVAKHQDRIELFELPRRAPELNPDEYLNNDLKRTVKDEGLPSSKKELRSRVQQAMHEICNLPQHIMNFFLHPCVA
jgi:transposase